MTDQPDPIQPTLRVLTPDATPEQVAAVVAVFSAMGGTEEDTPAPRSQWASPARGLRQPLHPGPGGWRASGLPR